MEDERPATEHVENDVQNNAYYNDVNVEPTEDQILENTVESSVQDIQ